MNTKKFEVLTETGKHYGFVEIPLIALQDGWESPRYVHVDGVICETNGKVAFVRITPRVQ